MINLSMNYIKFSENGRQPFMATAGSAGYDLYSTEDCNIEPGSRVCVGTGIGLQIPEGYFGQILSRSGLALEYGLNVIAGVIDRDYHDEIKVILHNTSNVDTIALSAGSRIAQIVFMQCYNPTMTLAENFDKSKHKGFGSTGVLPPAETIV